MNGRLVELAFSDGDADDLRSAYRDHVEAVDDRVGKLLDEVPGDTLVYVARRHRHRARGARLPRPRHADLAPRSYEIPYLIRHPDGEKSGDDVDWYASTPRRAPDDPLPPRPHRPGKMGGEDLMALFDDVDQGDLLGPAQLDHRERRADHRPDDRFLLVADREQIERRLYDDDEEADDDKKRYDDVASERARRGDRPVAAAARAGGRHPPGVRTRRGAAPAAERGDHDIDDDGIPNDFDAVDNEEPDDFDTRQVRSASTAATRRTAGDDAERRNPTRRVPLRAQVADLRRDDDRLGDVAPRRLDREHLDSPAAGRDATRTWRR